MKIKLAKCRTEEQVKALFVKYFGLTFNSDDRMDLYTPPVLWEFKLDTRLITTAPVVVAQALYYVRRLIEESTRPIPIYIAAVDRNEGALVPVSAYVTLFASPDFDWDRAPSSPDPKLVKAVAEIGPIRVFDFNNELDEFLSQIGGALAAEEIIARPVTAHNFEAVYAAWENALGLEGQNLSELFTDDVCLECWFDNRTGELASKGHQGKAQVPVRAYENFWSAYKRPPTLESQQAIRARRDRLRAIKTRRVEGEFFTPPLFAEKAVEYVDKALGANWQDEYVVWDCALGSGNLLWPLKMPGERVFGSTLRAEDAASVDWYQGATIFQFDFLNDPVEKLPAKLLEALKTGKVLFLMNPPYAEATSGGTTTEHKTGVKDTLIAKQLANVDLGKAANELFVQFFFRCRQLCQHASIAMFATLKYINAPAFVRFREQILDRYKFAGGMIFPAKVFQGTAGSWPVSFGIWTPSQTMHECQFDVLNVHGEKIGTKVVKPVEPGQYMNDWFKRPKGTVAAVPLSSAITVQTGKVRLEKLAEGALGYASFRANDMLNHNFVNFLSSCDAGGNGTSITPDLFDRIMVQVAVRKAIKPTWLNDRDQFQIPNIDPYLKAHEHNDPSYLPNSETVGEVNEILHDWDQFITACVVFNLFSGHNQTSEFTADYKGKKWPIKNEFFPFGQHFPKEYGPEIPNKNTFVNDWLEHPPKPCPKEASRVLELGASYYRLFFQNYNNVNRTKWKIEGANPGFYQIRNAMNEAGIGAEEYDELRAAVKALQDWIIPRVYEYGFLEPEALYD